MASLRTPLYREVLTPALHRRFTSAALITLVLCYGEAVVIADHSSSELDPYIQKSLRSDIVSVFWFWFPIGPAGIRTLLLFVSAISIFVLRVAQLHLGMAGRFSKRDSSTEDCTRSSDHSLTLRDFHTISIPPKHSPDIGMVLVLSMVVQRGLHVVGAKFSESRMGSCRKVSKALPQCCPRSWLMWKQSMGTKETQ